jgi:hypothetical protein
MQQNIKSFNLPRVMILTGFAFLIGGLFKSCLEWYLSQPPGSENFLSIFLMIWVGFLVESAIGMAALAFLLRGYYSFRRLWLAGTGAFALGILIPAIMMNQFFYALLIFPGFLVGVFFKLLLKKQSGGRYVLLMTTLAFVVCQVLVMSVRNDMPWFIWIYEHFGTWSVTFLMYMVQDMIIGIFVAMGVGLMLRKGSQE